MIPLKQITGNIIDLSISDLFCLHYAKQQSYARYILEKEINVGEWYDKLLADLPEDAVIIDAGTNVGLFSLYLGGKKRKFYCIEPTGNHIVTARDLFARFGITAEIFEGVLYRDNGFVNLFKEAGNSTMNRVADSGEQVESITLKSFLNKYELEKVDLLKLDVEGAEQQILMEDITINESLQKCKLIFVETHDGMDGLKVDIPGIIAKIKALGFTHHIGKRQWSHYFVNDSL